MKICYEKSLRQVSCPVTLGLFCNCMDVLMVREKKGLKPGSATSLSTSALHD